MLPTPSVAFWAKKSRLSIVKQHVLHSKTYIEPNHVLSKLFYVMIQPRRGMALLEVNGGKRMVVSCATLLPIEAATVTSLFSIAPRERRPLWSKTATAPKLLSSLDALRHYPLG